MKVGATSCGCNQSCVERFSMVHSGVRRLTGVCLIVWCGASFAQATDSQPGDPQQQDSQAGNPNGAAAKSPVLIGTWRYNAETRLEHSLPEVDGTTITVTKKTTVVNLEDMPTIIDNNQRALFDRMPGIVLAEQQNPT